LGYGQRMPTGTEQHNRWSRSTMLSRFAGASGPIEGCLHHAVASAFDTLLGI